ncbi:MAG TPA: hypothetical protein VLN45_00195 [Ignavibacteriaceae bacterium]|nr:hypothetical protein [Ignavibacteriaceae bacterium]
MKNLIFLISILISVTFAQSYKIEKITGSVKVIDSMDKWIEAKEGNSLSSNSILITGENSSAKISGDGISFTLKESSALAVSSLKQMTMDELLLALAMEDMMNAPRKKENKNGKTTAVYGTKEGAIDKIILSEDFGEKRLNGALQLAENGLKESAIITSKEIFRKYPSTKLKADSRIYFADLLFQLNLYEEAYDEFNSIKELKLSEKEKSEVENKISLLNKKLVNK